MGVDFVGALRDLLLVTGAAGIDGPGIPIHKLSSNDDWIVTPDECRSAVAAWRANRQRVADDELVEWANSGFGLGPRGRVRLAEPLARGQLVAFADEFMAWVAEAADHDGFEVR